MATSSSRDCKSMAP